ncbi:hypothetical protein D3C80_2067240 [compost metagenome]
MFDQGQTAWNALHMGHGEAVGHTRSDDGFGDGLVGQTSLCIEAGEAFGKSRSLGE